MNTNTNRHTARPSRLRVTLARVGAWIDRHDDAVTLTVTALCVALVGTILAVALVVDYSMTASHALMVIAVMGIMALVASVMSYMVATDKATRRVSRRYSRYMNEQTDKHGAQVDYLRSTIATLTHERNDWRRKSIASGSAYRN